jgi:hypothetical protein
MLAGLRCACRKHLEGDKRVGCMLLHTMNGDSVGRAARQQHAHLGKRGLAFEGFDGVSWLFKGQ